MPKITMLPAGVTADQLLAMAHNEAEAFETFNQAAGQTPAPMKVGLEELKKVGLVFWDQLYSRGATDEEVELAVCAYAREMVGLPHDLFDKFISPMAVLQLFFGAKWVDCACPQVQMPHTYAAALMATRVPEDMLEDLEAPWDAFVIAVPGGLLEMIDPSKDNRKVSADWIAVWRKREKKEEYGVREGWAYCVMSRETNMTMWRFGVPLKDFLLENLDENPFEEHPLNLPHEDYDRAVTVLIGRLIVNTIMAFQEVGNVTTTKSSKRANRPISQKHPPHTRVFKIGKPIKLDVRPALREYLDTCGKGRKSSSPSVRFLVRGHKRRQAYGPKHSLRKIVWVMPYWKGPEEAPVLTRTHEFSVDTRQMEAFK